MASSSSLPGRAIGWWRPGRTRPGAGTSALNRALRQLDEAAVVVLGGEGVSAATGGQVVFGPRPDGEALPLLGMVPALHPEELGHPGFLADHGVRYAYVAGAMANGIASVELVLAMARARMLGFFGAAGLAPAAVGEALARIRAELGDEALPWGVNLIHSPSEPEVESAVVDLLLEHGVRTVSASAYIGLTRSVVRYRVAGIHEGPDGAVIAPNRILAKVSRTEVASKFLAPPPERFLTELVASGQITEAQAVLARRIPMADDITAEADSGGHTDNRPLVVLLPQIQALRDRITREHGYARAPRVGAAGGLGTPGSIAAAFGLGAAYVVTGSINQATVEAGTSDTVRALLAKASTTDVTMAPAADMFEMGVELQVLSRGTLFPVRARKLYDLYKRRSSLDELSDSEVGELERSVFRRSLAEAWDDTARFWADRDPSQLTRAEAEPKHRMALLFRSYLGLSSRWANAGHDERATDFQVWCGPSMGAFNEWSQGGRFADWTERRAVPMARCLLVGAAVATRAAALRAQGATVVSAAEACAALSDSELDALLDEPWTVPPAETATTRVVGEGAAGEPIAIVGMACLFPEASDLDTFQRNLRLGVDAITEVPDRPGYWRKEDYLHPDPSAPDMLYTARGGYIDPVGFDPTEFGIPPTILEATDTSQLLGLWVAARALEDAGYGAGVSWDKDRASVILGVTGTQELVVNLGARLGHPKWRKALREAGVDEDTTEDVVKRIAASYVGWQENSFPGLLGNVVAGRIANRLDLGGTNCVIDAACASSLGAVEMGVMELRTGRSDVVVTGGVDTLNDVFMYQCFTATPALSKTGDARPFDADGDGTILGEGIGIVVLKRLSDAQRDGDRVHAVLTGIGSSSDGRARSIYAPRSSGQARAVRDAHRDAGVSPGEISLLEAHGTGTKAGDGTELAGLESVFLRAELDAGSIAVGSVKSMIGHTKASAGAAGLIKTALALENKILPPTLKVRTPLPALADGGSPLTLNVTARPWVSGGVARRAGVSAFGFGGSNFHAILEEAHSQRREPAWDGAVELLAFSAATGEALAVKLEAHAKSEADLTEIACRSRERFGVQAAARATLVVTPGDDWRARLREAAKRARAGSPGSTPDGVSIGFGQPSGALAFLFSGQGAQRVGMGAELACVFDEVLDELEAVPAVARCMHPPTVWSDEERHRQEQALRATDVAQPALGALGAGMLDVLRRFGVEPQMAAGHSFGELVALHAAGVLTREGLRAAASARGELMAGDGSDRGTMLAILAPLEAAQAAVDAVGQGLVLANINGPNQGIASGSRSAIDALAAECATRALTARPLSVGAAFHSPLVADAGPLFLEALAGLSLRPPAFPVYANSTGAPYPTASTDIAELLAGQLAQPVQWMEDVRALSQAGARTFVEIGPGATLTGMTSRILGDVPHTSLALDGNARRGGLWSLGWALAQLAALGHGVDLTPWERRSAPPRADQHNARTPRMSVPLGGANHRDPAPPIPPRPPVAAPNPQARPSSPAPASAPRPARTVVPPSPVSGVNMSKTDPQAAALVVQALQGAQEHLRALQSMQQQTAATHRAFLDGQAAAQSSFQALLDGQQRLIEQMLGMPASVRPQAASAPPQAYAPPAPGYVPPAPVSASPAPTYVPPAPAYVPPAPSSAAPVQVPVPPATAQVPLAPTQAALPPSPASVTQDTVGTLLAVVAEATGYPTDMLELDMDLESDLGIDSIKRVEILSLLTERLPGTPTVEPERLSALHTLRQVAEFVSGGAPESAAAEAVSGVSAETLVAHAPVTTKPRQDPATVLVEVVAEATGYPTDMLDLDMDLESDLGIDSIKRVEILSLLTERLPSAPTVEPEALGSLQTLRQVLEFVAGAPPAPSTTSIVAGAEPAAPAADPPPDEASALPERRAVTAVPFADAAADRPLPLAKGETTWILDDGSDLAQPLADALLSEGLDVHLVHAGSDAVPAPSGLILLGHDPNLAFSLLRTAGPHLVKAAERGSGMLLSVSRLDGGFGCLDGSAFTSGDALSAGLAGFVKTAAWEWPGLWCRALDVSAAIEEDPVVVSRVLAELRSAAPIEVGYSAEGHRQRLELRPLDAPGGEGRPPRGLVVVTGGARGVTAECAVALAEAGVEGLLLLGRSKAPDDEPDWLEAVDDAGVQRALLAHGFTSRPSPKELRAEVRTTLAAREIRRTLARLTDAGAKAVYASVDVRDVDDVAKALRRAERSTKLKARGVLHGAGVLRDKLIADKSDEDVTAVIGTKLDGLRSVLGAIGNRPLDFLGLFASVTGRFGRRGQSDYAAANRILDALAAREAARRPETRVVSWSWGPWDGGMVTADLKKAFTSEGVSLIGRAGGAAVCREEVFATGERSVHVVVGDGLDAGVGSPDPPVVHRPLSLDLERWPVLADHMLDGVPVLPFALAMELIAREARREYPGMQFAGLDDVRVLQGVQLDREVMLTPRLSKPVIGPEHTSITGELVDATGRARVRAVVTLHPPDRARLEVPSPVEWPSELRALSVGDDV
ncbi:MAG: PfaD family polyunsaturated fatty acid/polyketide biosynthesis protein, partial [Deltaproteobacteria bacterium]|nr:PfaD family polyunsaturated fatty acid/polyketide biosynthesis protein [Deltaproteobacteria bacterium]